MVLRRIPIYFLSTIFHDLKPKLASSLDVSGDGRKARNDSDKHAEMFKKSDKQFIRTFLSVQTALFGPF